MIIFYLLLIAFSNSEGFPSEPESSGYQDPSDCIHSENEDKIQGELKEQKTVFNKMMSNIKAEMTEMKECLLSSEENYSESIYLRVQLRWRSPSRRRLTGPVHRRRIMRASVIQVRVRTLFDHDSFIICIFDRVYSIQPFLSLGASLQTSQQRFITRIENQPVFYLKSPPNIGIHRMG